MSENATVKSTGTLTLVNGKRYKGELVCGTESAAFYTKKSTEPMVEFHYTKINRLDNIRRGGTESAVTVVLKSIDSDGERYTFELSQGLKVHQFISDHWPDKPVEKRTRADELHRLAELRGETIQKPKKHLITRRHPNRSIAGDIGVYLLLLIVACAMGFPLVFAIGSSLKPLDELFRFPPTCWHSTRRWTTSAT